MNLQENIQRIKEVMGILKEGPNVSLKVKRRIPYLANKEIIDGLVDLFKTNLYDPNDDVATSVLTTIVQVASSLYPYKDENRDEFDEINQDLKSYLYQTYEDELTYYFENKKKEYPDENQIKEDLTDQFKRRLPEIDLILKDIIDDMETYQNFDEWINKLTFEQFETHVFWVFNMRVYNESFASLNLPKEDWEKITNSLINNLKKRYKSKLSDFFYKNTKNKLQESSINIIKRRLSEIEEIIKEIYRLLLNEEKWVANNIKSTGDLISLVKDHVVDTIRYNHYFDLDVSPADWLEIEEAIRDYIHHNYKDQIIDFYNENIREKLK